jgi:hypothetical protein
MWRRFRTVDPPPIAMDELQWVAPERAPAPIHFYGLNAGFIAAIAAWTKETQVDHDRFDGITRALGAAATRRGLSRALAGGGLGVLVGSAFGALRLTGAVAARNKTRKKGKKRKRKPSSRLVVNQYGCVEVGQPCKGDSTLCCSGICQGAAPKKGKPDTSRCIAHGTGSCTQEGEGFCTATNPGALRCNNSINCACIETTAGSNFCYEGRADQAAKMCVQCRKDADCDALGFPPGSACAPVGTGNCAGLCATGMACLIPCGAAPNP